MATIITVHGTGATGPEEGDAWWQRGGAFKEHIRELVEGEDGALNFQRLIWDGANNETSRRDAARKLYETAEELESKGQKYCVVGHSHGGSVAADALLFAGSKGNKLPGLARWITVGTPFIQSVKAFWVFSRSGPLGKAALVSLALVLLRFAAYCFECRSSGTVGAAVPFSVLYGSLWGFNQRRLYMYRPSTLQFTAKTYATRLVSLRHENDEAINGLKSLQNLEVRILQLHFAVPIFSFVSVFILPVLAIVLSLHLPPGVGGNSLFENIGVVGGMLIYFVGEPIDTLMRGFQGSARPSASYQYLSCWYQLF